MAASSTPELRRYSIFRGWNWRRLDPKRVRVWNECHCAACLEPAVNHDLIISESNDASLNLSGVRHTPMDIIERRGSQMYAGSHFMCEQCWELWREGKIDDIILIGEEI
jgi:hypothetical protein